MPKAYVAPFVDDDGNIVAAAQTEQLLPSSFTVPRAIDRLTHHNGKPGLAVQTSPWGMLIVAAWRALEGSPESQR